MSTTVSSLSVSLPFSSKKQSTSYAKTCSSLSFQTLPRPNGSAIIKTNAMGTNTSTLFSLPSSSTKLKFRNITPQVAKPFVVKSDCTVKVTPMTVKGFYFPASLVKPPGSINTFFLSGAGPRNWKDKNGQISTVSADGVYLEDKAVSILAPKWAGKTEEELLDNVDFFKDIVSGEFETFTMFRLNQHHTGVDFSNVVVGLCKKFWKSVDIDMPAQNAAIQQFLDCFNDENLQIGSSVLFEQSTDGSLKISFSKDGSLPLEPKSVIKDETLSWTILYLYIGEHGANPAAKKSIANRMSKLLGGGSAKPNGTDASKVVVGDRASKKA